MQRKLAPALPLVAQSGNARWVLQRREGGEESQRKPSADLRHFATRLFTDTVKQWQSFSTRWWSEEAWRPIRGICGPLRRDPNVRPSFWKRMGEPFIFYKMEKGRIDLKSEDWESLGLYPRLDLDVRLGSQPPSISVFMNVVWWPKHSNSPLISCNICMLQKPWCVTTLWMTSKWTSPLVTFHSKGNNVKQIHWFPHI